MLSYSGCRHIHRSVSEEKEPCLQRIGTLKGFNFAWLFWGTLSSLCSPGDLREYMPSTNHPQSLLSDGLFCARQVHDDNPCCLLWSCDHNFFLMQGFIMHCFPLCVSKQVTLLSEILLMSLFPVYGVIFTWSYHRVPGNMHFVVITYYFTCRKLHQHLQLQRHSMRGFYSQGEGRAAKQWGQQDDCTLRILMHTMSKNRLV